MEGSDEAKRKESEYGGAQWKSEDVVMCAGSSATTIDSKHGTFDRLS